MKVPFAISTAIMLAACSMVPDYERPGVEVPAAWSVADADDARAVSAAWWRNFGDPELDALMTAALAANLDIASALARIEQSQGALRASGASLLPNVSGSGSGASRATDGGSARESASVGLTASYALDLWGRYRAQADAARSSLDATVYDRDATLLMVQSQVAISYFNILNAKDRLAIAEESLAAARETFRIAEARYNAGSTSALDIAQQRNNIANIEAGIPPLERDVAANQHALAILLGQAPQGFAVAGSSTAHLALPDIATGQPAALLERRPDIRRAEAQLIGANADIGAARAAFSRASIFRLLRRAALRPPRRPRPRLRWPPRCWRRFFRAGRWKAICNRPKGGRRSWPRITRKPCLLRLARWRMRWRAPMPMRGARCC